MSRGARISVAIVCLACAVAFAALPFAFSSPGPARHPFGLGFFVVEGFLVLCVVACIGGRVGSVAGRIVAACICIFYLGYIVAEIHTLQPALSTYRRSQASLLNAVIGFVVFGLPAAYYAFRGRLPGRQNVNSLQGDSMAGPGLARARQIRADGNAKYRSIITFAFENFDRTEREDFINPGNFGEDLARRLASGLTTRGVTVEPDIGQEDFGWEFTVTDSTLQFFVMLGVREDTAGEWLAFVEPARARGSVNRQQADAIAQGLAEKVAAEIASWKATNVKLHFTSDFNAGMEELGIDPTLG